MSLVEVEAAVGALNQTIGRYPPRFGDDDQRSAELRRWSRTLTSAQALPQDQEPERRLAALAELYRQGHNLDVPGAADLAASSLKECTRRFPKSPPCHLSASYFYLSVRPTIESLAAAASSLEALRTLALPGLSQDAEAGYVFYYLYASDKELAEQQIRKYLRAFPEGERADVFRRMQANWDQVRTVVE